MEGAEYLHTSLSLSSILLHSNLGNISTTRISNTEIKVRDREEDLENVGETFIHCYYERIAFIISPDIPVNIWKSSQNLDTPRFVVPHSLM